MSDVLSIARPISSLLTKSILLIIYFALVGCGAEKTSLKDESQTHSQSASLKVMDFELPNISPSSFNTPGQLKAYISIDDGEPIEMALGDDNALLSVDGITMGDHQLTLVFEHHSDAYGVVTVATVSKPFTISKGENLLSISQSEYQIAGLDNDNDGASNLAELSNTLQPTSPIEANNFPPEFITTSTLRKAENTVDPLKIEAADINGHLFSYELTGGVDSKSFTIEVKTGLLRFLAAPNFEAPTDKDANNIYEVEISITDEQGASTSQLFLVEVTDVNPEQAVQNLSLTQEPPVVMLPDEQIKLTAQGSGNGAINYSSSNNTVLSVDDNGQLSALSPGYSTITVSIAADQEYQAASIHFVIEVINSSFSLYGWVGKEGSDLMIPGGMEGVEFYRSTDPQCDLINYMSCQAGSLSILDESDFFDTTARLDQVAYYTFVKENKKASGGYGGRIFTGRSGHQAIAFNGKIWVIGGSAVDGYKSDIWSSTDGVFWKKEVDDAGFSPRFGHQVIEFNNKLWLIGGRSEEGVNNDIWSSLDGIHWSLVTASAEFSPRDGHQIVEFQNELWLVAGNGASSFNDVWHSSDGITWTAATSSASFSARSGHQMVVFQGKLFVIGGASSGVGLNDVWTSINGEQWTKTSPTLAPPSVFSHQALVYNNKIWLVGGDEFAEDYGVWSSNDGVNWNKEAQESTYNKRQNHQLVVFNDSLWLIGGRTLALYLNDVWSSSNGVSWQRQKYESTFSSRGYHRSVSFQDKLWVVGGFDGELKNDIWSSTNGLYWEQMVVSAPFSKRFNHELVVFNDTLFLIGGNDFTTGTLTDIWSSNDGISWTEVTSSSPFTKGLAHKLITFNNKLWAIGIVDNGGEYIADVWNTYDGADWQKVEVNTLPTNLYDFSISVLADKIWLYTGYDLSEGYQNSIWSTEDGITWKQEVAAADFPPRVYQQLITFNDQLFLIGGAKDNTKYNDIWRSADGLNWQVETNEAEFTPRSGFQIVEYQNNLFITGGSFENLTSEVWKSNDGINWKLGFTKRFLVE